MKTKTILFISILSLICIQDANAQFDYEWTFGNTGTAPGERIIAIIDAGNIGPYDGIGLVGEVFDDNGNWGQALPMKSDFKMFLKFSGSQNYGIVQERKTSNIILRLRKISDSLYHFTADCPYNHKSVSVKFDAVISSGVSLSLGSPNVINTTGNLVISEPTYVNYFDGNFGIGTTTPGNKLEVNGTIRSKEVIVEATNWPDYVFEEDYNLTSLKELEAYIKANKHLPEIPSAKEMEANGIILGEMNMLLLKKIEELTLHTIQQQKELDTQKELYEQTINLLLQRIEALEQKSE